MYRRHTGRGTSACCCRGAGSAARRRRPRRRTGPEEPHASAAKSALDRIVIPQEVLDRIEATASPRSSLIISDEALSPETGKGTEFVAVLSDEPQGGLAVRRRSPATEFGYARQRERQFYWRPPFGAPFFHPTW